MLLVKKRPPHFKIFQLSLISIIFLLLLSSGHMSVSVKSATAREEHGVAAFISLENKVHLIFYFMVGETMAWPSAF